MTNSKRRILATGGLLYANGPLHLGHILESIQIDIWMRFQRMNGHECYFICGDDAHGTPIMLDAEKKGITPEKLIEEYYGQHKADLEEFLISHDNYHTTHSEENQTLTELIYNRLEKGGDIKKRTITQAFDPVKQIFLPDRYVNGTCPKCRAENQHGDSCEVCGATYSPTDLINPISVVSNQPPIYKDSEHYFFCLDHYTDMLKDWTQAGHLQSEITKKLNEWFEAGLEQWDISRDAPYFGFKIPGTEDKYFYVWLDAPIGYMASFKNYCNQHNINFDDFWQKDSQTELYHFIGKDITYFHALFWPAMLSGSEHRTPSAIYAHGFLTVDGHKMSKSKGTFIKARTYLNHFNPEYLRYYFAAKLTPNVEDLDLNLEDFVARINSDLVGKYINIASRCASFIHRNFNDTLSANIADKALLSQFTQAAKVINEHYEKREFSKAIREIMTLADIANKYIADEAPWKQIKDHDPKAQQHVHDVCSLGIHLFRILTIYLKPVLPNLAQEVEQLLNISPLTWHDAQTTLINHQINPFKPLLTRINPKDIDKMIEESKPAPTPKAENNTPKIKDTINFDDFAKVDLRVAKILKAEHVEEADKLLKLTVDIGEDKPRQIFAGIKSAFNEPEKLEGKFVVVVANLAPRKMRFGLSEGMMLVAVGDGKNDLWLVEPQEGVKPGMSVQ